MPASFVLFIVFLVLKLTHVIAWSWLWVTSPLWIGFGLFLLFVGVMFFFGEKVLDLVESGLGKFLR